MSIELETRSCGCGCGATFRCMSSSPQKYISQGHECDGTGKTFLEVSKPRHDRLRKTAQLPPGAVSGKAIAEAIGVSYFTILAHTKKGTFPFERVEFRANGALAFNLGCCTEIARKLGMGKFKAAPVSSASIEAQEMEVDQQTFDNQESSPEIEQGRTPEITEENTAAFDQVDESAEVELKPVHQEAEPNEPAEEVMGKAKGSVSEVSRHLGVHVSIIYNWIKKGLLKKETDESGATVIDFDTVKHLRAQMRTRKPRGSSDQAGPAKKPGRRKMLGVASVPNDSRFAEVIEQAKKAAETCYRKVLVQISAEAGRDGDAALELALLRHLVQNQRFQFEARA